MFLKITVKNTALFLFMLLFSCGNSTNTIKNTTPNNKKNPKTICTGADNYDAYLPLLKNKRIAVVTNQTGVVTVKENKFSKVKKTKISIVDFLIQKKINVRKIFAPEHGFRGTADAGETVKAGKDVTTGLPIVSLYGKNKKPKPEQLTDIDIVLFDLQDVGVRFYTYISTLHYVMEACAENNVTLFVLDRPNPNGSIVDGPVLEKEHKSFVGMHPIPVLHGMTIGEYAQMINGEKWLKNNVQCNLKILPCLHYSRTMPYSLPIKPSPNLPNAKAINLYPSLCFFEGTNVSVGRGTTKQFQVYGSPYLNKTVFHFTPKPNEGAKNPKHKGKICYGEDLTTNKPLTQLELQWLIKAYKQNSTTKNVFFNSFFTKLAGTKKLQQQIENNISEQEIRKSWQEGLTDFKKIRKKYLIYNL